MKILVIDDSFERWQVFSRNLIGNEKVIHAPNYDSAVQALESETFDLIFFDHDLSYEQEIGKNDIISIDEISYEKTGADVAKFLVANIDSKRWPQEVIIHSLNPSGSQNIQSILIQADIKATKIPFLSLFK